MFYKLKDEPTLDKSSAYMMHHRNEDDILEMESPHALAKFEKVEGQLGKAPLCIELLAQLCLIATKKDFSLLEYNENRFELLKFPNSFRASLLQVGDEAYWAFNEAHNAMAQIELETYKVT